MGNRLKGRDWSCELWALGTGMLLFFSFPKYGTGFMAWIALVPLLRAIEGKNVSAAFRLGFISGLVAHLGLLYWIAYVVATYGNLSYLMGLVALVLLSGYMSLYTAVFASGISYAQTVRLSPILAVPVLWTSLEYIKTYAFTGFPWALLGYSQFKFPVILQISDLTGIYGVSFVIALINVLIYRFIFHQGHKARLITSIVFIVGVTISYGWWRMNATEKEIKQAEGWEVAIVQGNVDQSIKWDPTYQQATMKTYLKLSEKVARDQTRLIVWPETAAPFFYQDPSPYRAQLTSMVREKNVWLLFGSPSYRREEGGRITIFNSVYLLNPQGLVQGKYDKVHLVPYGEYVPLRKVFPFISKLVHGIGDFGTGPGYIPMEMENTRIGVLICYEAIFPEAARTYMKESARLLVNVTNDAWFGNSSAPYQHLAMAVLRAVECKSFLIRAANTGISAIVDPLGRMTGSTPLFTATTLSGQVKLMRSSTFYSRHGDVFSYVCLGLVLAGILISGRRKVK